MTDTREILLEGLRQALQARVANIWTNATSASQKDENCIPIFKSGITSAAKFYEQAVKAVNNMELTDGD